MEESDQAFKCWENVALLRRCLWPVLHRAGSGTYSSCNLGYCSLSTCSIHLLFTSMFEMGEFYLEIIYVFFEFTNCNLSRTSSFNSISSLCSLPTISTVSLAYPMLLTIIPLPFIPPFTSSRARPNVF